MPLFLLFSKKVGIQVLRIRRTCLNVPSCGVTRLGDMRFSVEFLTSIRRAVHVTFAALCVLFRALHAVVESLIRISVSDRFSCSMLLRPLPRSL